MRRRKTVKSDSCPRFRHFSCESCHGRRNRLLAGYGRSSGLRGRARGGRSGLPRRAAGAGPAPVAGPARRPGFRRAAGRWAPRAVNAPERCGPRSRECPGAVRLSGPWGFPGRGASRAVGSARPRCPRPVGCLRPTACRPVPHAATAVRCPGQSGAVRAGGALVRGSLSGRESGGTIVAGEAESDIVDQPGPGEDAEHEPL